MTNKPEPFRSGGIILFAVQLSHQIFVLLRHFEMLLLLDTFIVSIEIFFFQRGPVDFCSVCPEEEGVRFHNEKRKESGDLKKDARFTGPRNA